MNGQLSGDVALVTGAAGGLGLEICRALKRAGATIALADRDRDGLARAVQELGGGDDVETFPTELAVDDETTALPRRVQERFGTIDVVVNNAGIRQIAAILDTSPDDWRRTLDLNLTSVFVLTRAVIPMMIDQGRGKIVNIASTVGELAFPDRAAYCSAKAGLMMLTKSVAVEYAGQGVWCNAVAPGVTETPLTREYFRTPEVAESIRRTSAMQRWGQPSEIAGPVVFLSGPDSDYVNGTTLFADGGWTAGKSF